MLGNQNKQPEDLGPLIGGKFYKDMSEDEQEAWRAGIRMKIKDQKDLFPDEINFMQEERKYLKDDPPSEPYN